MKKSEGPGLLERVDQFNERLLASYRAKGLTIQSRPPFETLLVKGDLTLEIREGLALHKPQLLVALYSEECARRKREVAGKLKEWLAAASPEKGYDWLTRDTQAWSAFDAVCIRYETTRVDDLRQVYEAFLTLASAHKKKPASGQAPPRAAGPSVDRRPRTTALYAGDGPRDIERENREWHERHGANLFATTYPYDKQYQTLFERSKKLGLASIRESLRQRLSDAEIEEKVSRLSPAQSEAKRKGLDQSYRRRTARENAYRHIWLAVRAREMEARNGDIGQD